MSKQEEREDKAIARRYNFTTDEVEVSDEERKEMAKRIKATLARFKMEGRE